MTNETLSYYAANATAFAEGTLGVDFSSVQNRFLRHLSPGASILDLGCGSGRDSKAFLELGYRVTSVDGSPNLCRFAKERLGLDVRELLFQELDYVDCFDAVWACASILHLPLSELPDTFCRIHAALKAEGTLYTSFKYGDFEGMRNGRHFTDFTEAGFQRFLEENKGFEILEMWSSGDVRAGRGAERWLNLILKKI